MSFANTQTSLPHFLFRNVHEQASRDAILLLFIRTCIGVLRWVLGRLHMLDLSETSPIGRRELSSTDKDGTASVWCSRVLRYHNTRTDRLSFAYLHKRFRGYRP